MPDSCALCDAATTRKHGTHTAEDAAPTTCVPRYVVSIRSGPAPSPWYYEDDKCWVGECEFCGVPMVVSHAHSHDVSDEDRQAMLDKLTAVVSEHYGYQPWFDETNLRIPEHFHVHARPLGRLFTHGLPRVPVATS